MSSTRPRGSHLFHFLLFMSIFGFIALLALSGSEQAAQAEDPTDNLTTVDSTSDTEDLENPSEAQALPKEESSLTRLQKAIDAARESDTPDAAVTETRNILNILAEEQSKHRRISTDLQSAMRRATLDAQDIASSADGDDENWKPAFQEKLQDVQEQLDKAVAHDEDAHQFAAVAVLCVVAAFFLFFICLAVPELGCLIIILVFIAAMAALVLL